MSFGLRVNRPLIAQWGDTFSFAVTTTAQPVLPNVDKTKLINSFMVSNPVGGISVFLGFQPGVLITTGLEIPGGTLPSFPIFQEGRQLYELQGPVENIAGMLNCRDSGSDAIPFVVWDMSQVFLVASANTTVTIATFKAMFT